MHRAVIASILCLFVFFVGASAAHAQIPIGIGDVAGALGLGGTKTVFDPKALTQAILLYKKIQQARKIAQDEADFVRHISASQVKGLWDVGYVGIDTGCAYGDPWRSAVNHGRVVSNAYNYVLGRMNNLGCDSTVWPSADHQRAAARNRILEDMLRMATTDAGQARENAVMQGVNYDELLRQLGTIEDRKVSQKDLLRLIAYATTVTAIAQKDTTRNTLATTQLLAAQITEQTEMNRALLNAELYRRDLLRSTRPARLEVR